jgi:hypothetical protein
MATNGLLPFTNVPLPSTKNLLPVTVLPVKLTLLLQRP